MSWQTQTFSARTLTALLEASSAINSSLDLREVLQAIARAVPSVVGSEASSVLLLDPRRNKLIFRAAVGQIGEKLLDTEFDATLGIAGYVVRTGKPATVADAQRDRRHFKGFDADSNGKFTTRDLIAAPLLQRGEVLGVVEAVNKADGPFTQQDLQVLRVFGNLAAVAVANAQQHERLRLQNLGLMEDLASRCQIIGNSAPLCESLRLGKRVAASNATVLLLGETGTGKEVLARYVHEQSPRADKPLVAVNCAALSETLLESELFGHEKGAFTGAIAQKVGRFELADGGTLFLDEIGEIPAAVQAKLLRVLQEKEFVRVGGTRTIACDVRVLAATNRDLPAAIRDGRFRQDLYYRLNVFPIELAPLRARQEDIPPLVEHFAQRCAKSLGVPQPHLSSQAMGLLIMYPWPGNVRELQNVVERAVLLAEGEILPRHLPPEITEQAQSAADAATPGAPPGGAPAPAPSLWGYEKALIVKALTDCKWNQSKAARTLGITRDNLRYRVKKYNIKKP